MAINSPTIFVIHLHFCTILFICPHTSPNPFICTPVPDMFHTFVLLSFCQTFWFCKTGLVDCPLCLSQQLMVTHGVTNKDERKSSRHSVREGTSPVPACGKFISRMDRHLKGADGRSPVTDRSKTYCLWFTCRIGQKKKNILHCSFFFMNNDVCYCGISQCTMKETHWQNFSQSWQKIQMLP